MAGGWPRAAYFRRIFDSFRTLSGIHLSISLFKPLRSFLWDHFRVREALKPAEDGSGKPCFSMLMLKLAKPSKNIPLPRESLIFDVPMHSKFVENLFHDGSNL